jgi:hypothetical protein
VVFLLSLFLFSCGPAPGADSEAWGPEDEDPGFEAQVSAQTETTPQSVRRVRVADGDMVQESEIRERRTYTLSNNDSKARTVIIEHPARTPTGETTGNSLTPLQDLTGTITPSDLHFERHHAGIPAIDPARHQLLLHGLVNEPLCKEVGADAWANDGMQGVRLCQKIMEKGGGGT